MTARLKGSYSVPEVAQMLGFGVQRARRYLRAKGVELPRGKGRRAVIPLTVLLKKLSDDVESAGFVQRLQRTDGSKEG